MSIPLSQDAGHPATRPAAALGRIADLCAEMQDRAPAGDGASAGIEAITKRLGEPLQVAVAGRVKAGKSTFVNAFLGQRVARTDARECTRAVTWFRYGPAERVTVVGRDGTRRRRGLDAEGLVPADLGLPVDQVAAVEVELSLDRLRTVSLADTPGLASPDATVSHLAEDLLGLDRDSEAAIAGAEAVLFVMNQTVREGDLHVIQAFRAMARAASDPVSTLAVLNKADLFDDADPMATGERIAARHAAQLRGEVSGVLAYSGLLAEAARCGTLTEADAAAVEQLAGLDPEVRARLLVSEAKFCRGPADLAEAARHRLWRLLREAGLRTALDAVGAGARGASALRRHLDARSGHAAVDRHVGVLFEANAPALKAAAALDDLESVAWAAGGTWGEDLRDRLEALRLEPALHVLAELAALRAVRRGEADLPDDLAAELTEIVTGARLVDGGLRRWRAYANGDVAPGAAHVARTVVRSYEIAGEGHA